VLAGLAAGAIGQRQSLRGQRGLTAQQRDVNAYQGALDDVHIGADHLPEFDHGGPSLIGIAQVAEVVVLLGTGIQQVGQLRVLAPMPTSANTAPASAPTLAASACSPPNASTLKPSPPTPPPAAGREADRHRKLIAA
jgi:hypothetical protein